MIPVLALAQDTLDPIKRGLGETGQEAGFRVPDAKSAVPETQFIPFIGKYVGGLSIMLGSFYLVLMIYVGYTWMTARGNDEQVEKAKKVAVNATIALGVLFLARIVALFVLEFFGAATGN